MGKSLISWVKMLAGSGVVCAAVVASAGCRPRPPVAPVQVVAPTGITAAQQTREKQLQKYILKRRAAARQNSRTHIVH